ncbi:MAG: hypothetical protein NW224_02000 [Leptolyngbyaceae cyanobacterium bins.302]|nr:hypothetical protein [Leptolyngbyaceae cyanobacterium bins.302]
MSWLKLTAGYLYLMKGGSDQYIDRVKINQTSSTNEKIEGSIAEFPHEWFESEVQRPKTIIVNLDEERDGQSKLDSFTTVQLLKRFEAPVSYQFFEDLKTSNKISDLVKKFEDIVGTRFSDDFFLFNDAEKSWKITSRIKFTEDFEIKTFPLNPINPADPDADEEEPSFISILLEVIWNSGYTIKPYLLNNPNEDSKIVVELNIEKAKASLSPQKVTVSTLEKAVIPKEFKRKDENQKVGEVLKQLSDERKIVVNTPNDMADRDAEFNFDGQLTFTDVMDIIALNHDAFWDWQGRDSAFLRRTIAG